MIGYECNITRSNHAQYPLLEIKNMNTAIEGTATIFKNPTFAGVKLLPSQPQDLGPMSATRRKTRHFPT